MESFNQHFERVFGKDSSGRVGQRKKRDLLVEHYKELAYNAQIDTKAEYNKRLTKAEKSVYAELNETIKLLERNEMEAAKAHKLALKELEKLHALIERKTNKLVGGKYCPPDTSAYDEQIKLVQQQYAADRVDE